MYESDIKYVSQITNNMKDNIKFILKKKKTKIESDNKLD